MPFLRYVKYLCENNSPATVVNVYQISIESVPNVDWRFAPAWAEK